MKLGIFLVLISALVLQTNCLVPPYPSSIEVVHHLDEFKKPEIVEAVKKFKEEISIKYKNSREILGAQSQCNFDVSAMIEGTNKDSGRFINNLGFYYSCAEDFRPKDKSKSLDSTEFSMNFKEDPVDYKKYYLAKINWLFKVLQKTYIGYCVPEVCTADDIHTVVTAIFGANNFQSVNVVDVVQFKKDTMSWDLGGYFWVVVVSLAGIMASVATAINQKKVKAEKAEKERLKEMGEGQSAN